MSEHDATAPDAPELEPPEGYDPAAWAEMDRAAQCLILDHVHAYGG